MSETLTIEQVPIKDLKPMPSNAKKHPPEQLARLEESIKEFGFKSPILITQDNFIISGHGRCKVGKKLGFVTLPAVRLQLTEAQAKALNIADNLTSSTEYDDDILNQAIKELQQIEFNLAALGMDDLDINDRLTETEIKADLSDYEGLIDIQAQRQTEPEPRRQLSIEEQTGQIEELTDELQIEMAQMFDFPNGPDRKIIRAVIYALAQRGILKYGTDTSMTTVRQA